jgi:hypothetical protein
MITSKEALEKRLTQLKREVLTRGFERHPSVLKNVSDLPVEFQSPAMTRLAADEAIRTIIFFPPQIHRGWHYVPKQALLFTPTDVSHLLASVWPDQEPQVTYLKSCRLMYMKVTLILLYGFLEIVAQGHSSPARLSVEFNAVFWDLLSPPFRNLLQTTEATPATLADESTYSPTVQQALEKLPLKFSNGVRIHGLLPGEELEELIFQPGTWKRWLLLFRKPISADTLLLLTSNYMVVIQEELGVGQGWIISYLPRNSIAGMQNQTRSLGNELTIQLQREEQTAEYKLLLKSEVAEAWRERWVQRDILRHLKVAASADLRNSGTLYSDPLSEGGPLPGLRQSMQHSGLKSRTSVARKDQS